MEKFPIKSRVGQFLRADIKGSLHDGTLKHKKGPFGHTSSLTLNYHHISVLLSYFSQASASSSHDYNNQNNQTIQKTISAKKWGKTVELSFLWCCGHREISIRPEVTHTDEGPGHWSTSLLSVLIFFSNEGNPGVWALRPHWRGPCPMVWVGSEQTITSLWCGADPVLHILFLRSARTAYELVCTYEAFCVWIHVCTLANRGSYQVIFTD